MLKELKEKLDNLPENYAKDIDIVALKALRTVPETEEIVVHVKGLVEKLEAKYVNDDEIKNLIPKDEMTLEKLVELLEEKYATNIDFITLKAMLNLPESPEREKAIKVCLAKLNKENEDIKLFLEGRKKKILETTFVGGGKYIPSFYSGELETLDLDVSTYLITQDIYEKIIGENPSEFKLSKNPVENISWWDALKFCNALSEAEGLEPVYDIKDTGENKDLKINLLNREKVEPELADFSRTEGYRLPTEVEWEWFARGGNKAIENGSFNYKYAGSNSLHDVGWDNFSSNESPKIVGLKQPNALGLYDCSGNVWEWCYDSVMVVTALTQKRSFEYNHKENQRRIRGGSWANYSKDIEIVSRIHKSALNDEKNDTFFVFSSNIYGIHTDKKLSYIGIRVVKTANPII